MSRMMKIDQENRRYKLSQQGISTSRDRLASYTSAMGRKLSDGAVSDTPVMLEGSVDFLGFRG